MSRHMQPEEHGSPRDRGGADAYYGRAKSPHKYPNGTYNGDPVTDLTQGEIDSYNQGFDSQTVFKDYG